MRRRYTGFVIYPHDEAVRERVVTARVQRDELLDLLEAGRAGVEEIDVDVEATSEYDHTAYGRAVEKIREELARDYEPGGSLWKVEERFGWYT